jgi:hypothetical protein
VAFLRTRKDKQNRRFLRNSRDAAALITQSETSELNATKFNGALRRTNKVVSLARFKSDKTNYHLTKTLVNALLGVSSFKLSRKEASIIKKFNELMHMDLRQARMSKSCPTKEDVHILFGILRRVNPKKADSIAQTFKFRKIL